MTKKALFFLTLTVLVSMLVSASLLAANKSAADKVNGYNVPVREFTPRQTPDKTIDPESLMPKGSASRMPLGSALKGSSRGVGTAVDVTYEDFQIPWPVTRTVAVSNIDDGNAVDVHFVYEDFPDTVTGTVKRSGYNVYNANDGEWPVGSSGCLLQPSAARGGVYVGLDVMPDGFAAMAVTADREGEFSDTGFNHDIWFQNLRHNCSFTHTWVPRSVYHNFWWTDTLAKANYPSIAVQEIGADTIVHLVLGQSAYYTWHGIQNNTYHVVTYFRKTGHGEHGTWSNGQTIDTMFHWGYRVAAQKGGSKVAVAYLNTSDSGKLIDDATGCYFDNDVFYRESTNGGLTWGPRTNITNYSAGRQTRVTGAAGGPDISACYDNTGNLHVVWCAQAVPIQPYRNGWGWSDFNADLWHWSSTSNIISMVADGTYDPLDFPGWWNGGPGSGNYVVCAFGPMLSQSYITKPEIAQCGDYMYVIWNQMHSKITTTLPGTAEDSAAAVTDCAVAADRNGAANWEVFVAVSNGVAGELWDNQRNLTNSFTPNCHPDSGAGRACGDEFRPSLSVDALDETGLALSWPDNLVTPPGTPFVSNKFLQVSYLDDKLPGAFWKPNSSWPDDDNRAPTLNDVKWFRLACVEPKVEAIIEVNHGDILWPDHVQNGDPMVVHPVVVTNRGNATLNVTSIATTETSGSGWLSVTPTSLTVTAGSSNTGTFDIRILPPASGGPQWLEGDVTINSNASNYPVYVIHIKILAAAVVTHVAYDTVATSTAWDTKGIGDNVALAVSNYGEIGRSGQGNTNLDFVLNGNECDTTKNWYLYAASPYYIQKVGTAYRLTSSHYGSSTNEQGREDSWDPATGTVMSKGLGSHDGVSYDSVYAGKSVNRDTTVAMERTFYAPRGNTNNPSFVVTKTVLYSVGGAARSGITFGTATDWDIPSDSSSTNTSAVVLGGNPYVYYQGTNHPDSTPCQSNLTRFGAEVLAGWYTKAAYAADPCTNDSDIVSMKAVNVRRFFDDTLIAGLNQANAKKWWDSTAVPGFAGMSTGADQGGFVTFLHNYNLAANDTLTFWTILATQRTGTLGTFTANITDAKAWYKKLRVPCGCCAVMGNVDGSGDGLVTMGDLTVLIDNLFITLTPLACNDEGNVDLSPDGLVTMGDLTVLIDNLFITLSPLPTCAQLP